ncbi:Hpt domain-containing protein [Leptothrix cholodnii]|nr:Hpt domain-containing protein [Leptothrix cholodnii]
MDPQHTTAATPVADDLSALAWVHEELRKTLEQAHKGLRRYLREVEASAHSDLDDVEPTILRNARQHLHEGVGALQLVNVPEGALLLRASEAAVQRYVAKPQRMDMKGVEAVERASFALLDYLGRRLSGKPAPAVGLFPQLRVLLELNAAERIHPADLWPHDWRWRAVPALASVPHAADAALLADVERRMLALVKQNSPEAAAALTRAFGAVALAAAPVSLQEATLWSIAAGFFEAWGRGLLVPDLFLKRTASRAMAAMRARVRGDADVSERLAQDLLFFCERAVPAPDAPAPHLAAVRTAYQLADEPAPDYTEPRFGRHDPSLIQQARKRVVSAKESWNGVAGTEPQRLANLGETFGLVGDSMRKLYAGGGRLADALAAAADVTARQARPPAPQLAMEVATSLLYLEAALDEGEFDHPDQAERAERLAQRIERVTAGAAAEPLEPWMEELYRRVSDRQTMGSVVQELRASLSEVERQIDQFFRSPSESGLLAAVPDQLASMRGVFSVLAIAPAMQAVARMRSDVEQLLHVDADPRSQATLASFQRLAGNLGALGFLIDMLSVQPQMTKQLFRFDMLNGVLAPVMGRSAMAPDLVDRAQAIADAVRRNEVPLAQVSAELASLSQEATVNDQPALAASLSSAQAALSQAAEAGAGRDTEGAAREYVAQAMDDFVATATSPMGLDPIGLPMISRPMELGPEDTPAFAPTGLEDDHEMRGVFLEESAEVLADAQAALAELNVSPSDLSAMITTRRAFHTLKGSSRMVGFAAFGEAAWACEQLYNHALAEQSPASADLRTFTGDALAYFAAWISAIGHGTEARFTPDPVMAAADTLRLAGELMRVHLPGEEAPSSPPQSDYGPLSDLIDLEVPFGDTGAPVVETLQATQPVRLPPIGSPEVGEPMFRLAPEIAAPVDVDLVLDFDVDAPLPEPPQLPAHETADEVVWASTAPAPESFEPVAEPPLIEPIEIGLPPAEVADAERPDAGPPDFDLPDTEAPDAAALEAELDGQADADTRWSAEPPSLLDAEFTVVAPLDALADVPDAPVWPTETEAPLLTEVIEPQPLFDAVDAAALLPHDLPVLDEVATVADFGAVPAEVDALEIPEVAVEPELPVLSDEQAAAYFAAPEFVQAPPSEPHADIDLSETGQPADEPAVLSVEPFDERPADVLAELPPDAPDVPVAPDDVWVEPPVAPEPVDAPLEIVDQVDAVASDEPDEPPAPVRTGAAVFRLEDFRPSAPLPIAPDERRADEQIKVVGPLRLQIPLFNIFLNEADELSRRLNNELALWSLELDRPVGETAGALAHSLAGCSATVGFADLSQLARELEHALGRAQYLGAGDETDAELFIGVADEIRRLLHQFAAGFLQTPAPGLHERLQAWQEAAAQRLPVRPPETSSGDSTLDASGAVSDFDALPTQELIAAGEAIDVMSLDFELPTDSPADLVVELGEREAGFDAAPEPVFESGDVLDLTLDEPVAQVAASDAIATDGIDEAPAAADALAPALPADEPVLQPTLLDADMTVWPLAAESADIDLQALSQPSDERVYGAMPAAVDLPLDLPWSVPSKPLPLDGLHEEIDADIDQQDQVDAELFPIFDEEAQELLPQLAAQVAEWQRAPADPSAATACMRTLHTFKGSARLAGAMRLGELAHRFESAIERLIGHGPVAAADLDDLQRRADGLSAAFDAVRAAHGAAPASMLGLLTPPSVSGAWGTRPVPLSEHRSEFASLSGLSPLDTGRGSDTGFNIDQMADGGPPSTRPAVLASAFSALSADADGSDPIDWSRFLGDAEQLPLHTPDRAPTSVQPVRVRAALLDRLVNLAGEVSITRSRLEAEVGSIRASMTDLTENLERLNQQLRDVTLQAETQLESRLKAARAASQEFDPLELDRYTRLQELTRMMAESVNDVATVRSTMQRTVQAAEDELAVQARLTRELQGDLLRTRMVEFESLSERLYRVVRQASKETGKQVRFDIVGGSIEVDRGVLDRMTAAFEHLLRNCVTHGIEAPEQRVAAGKDPTGSIVVSLEQEGNEVSVEIRDDGAGLDLPRIRERAVAMGLITSGAELSENELANLILAPGLSTMVVVTELAGRGVGMDVVRSDVHAMGGRIETRSQTGRGTRFKLVLPLTTVVTQVVILRAGARSIAVPSNLVELVQRAAPGAIDQAYQQGRYSYGGLQLPFFWLGALLESSGRGVETGRTLPVVIVRSAQQRVALHVDEIQGSHEVVVKNLGPQLSRLPGLAGMTLLASGAVALIYNPVALASVYGESALRLMQLASAMPANAPTQPGQETIRPAPLVLVVDDSLTVRRVTKRLLEREGYRVALAKDGLEALDALSGERPVAVLSDIEMPRMDGFDLLRNIRGDAELASLPVIMITSRIAKKHRDIATELGANHYLGKPYSEEELLGLLRQHAGAQRRAVA